MTDSQEDKQMQDVNKDKDGNNSSIAVDIDSDLLKEIILKSLTELANEKIDDDTKVKPRKRARTVTKDDKKKKDAELVNPMIKYYSPPEKYYYKNLTPQIRQYIAECEVKVSEMNDESTPLRFKILASNIDDKIKAIAIKKLDYLNELDASSSEYYKISNWIDSVCKLPIGINKKLPINHNSSRQEIREFLTGARDHLDKVVYGHKEAKDQIIRLIAQWIVNPDAKGMVIGIHGKMGVGKTTLIKDSICKVLGLPFAFIPLGGANDGCYLEGHSYTYEGATWGKIVDTLMKCKCMNPVFYFDELDKVSHTHKGDEIINILIHMTDQSQNENFCDKYFVDFNFDLSKSLIIFSYNHEEEINPILRDRMIRIETKGYSVPDKVSIVINYMLPQILAEYNFKPGDIKFSEDIIKHIIETIEHEDGVRNLKRAVQNIVSHINLKMLMHENEIALPYDVLSTDVKNYVNNKRSDNTSLPMMYM